MRYTENAQDELMREKSYTPEETRFFLGNPENFLTISTGIKRELYRLGCDGDDKQLLNSFKKLLSEKGLNSASFKQEKKWFNNETLPRRESAIKLCFAFELDEQQSCDFLWKVCKLNGFNFRCAEDIIYYYCLASKRSYADALNLLHQYDECSIGQNALNESYTKNTHTLRMTFSDLKDMSEQDFMEKLLTNKKNFIGYSVTAHKEFLKIYNNVARELKIKIIEDSILDKYGKKNETESNMAELTYSDICRELNAILYHDECLTKDTNSVKNLSNHITRLLTKFLNPERLKKLHNDPKRATEKEFGSARNTFVLFYFINFVLHWGRYLNGKINDKNPPVDFFERFYRGLNGLLDKCGYGYLYYADSFDWLILSCIKSLNDNDQSGEGDDLDALSLYQEALACLIEE